MKLPFGKYKGCDSQDVPESYLAWLADWEHLREPLKSAIRAERERRELAQPVEINVDVGLVDELVGAGVRALAKKYHPDCGGSHEQVVAVNAAGDWLRQQARMLS